MPIDPCGSIMDWIRTSYQTEVYSFDPATGTMVPQTIDWYKAAAGAQPIGVHHQYASSYYTKGISYPDQVGEIPTSPKLYRKGVYLPGALGTNH